MTRRRAPWYVAAIRHMRQYNNVRTRLAAALWELRRLRREVDLAWNIQDEIYPIPPKSIHILTPHEFLGLPEPGDE